MMVSTKHGELRTALALRHRETQLDADWQWNGRCDIDGRRGDDHAHQLGADLLQHTRIDRGARHQQLRQRRRRLRLLWGGGCDRQGHGGSLFWRPASDLPDGPFQGLLPETTTYTRAVKLSLTSEGPQNSCRGLEILQAPRGAEPPRLRRPSARNSGLRPDWRRRMPASHRAGRVRAPAPARPNPSALSPHAAHRAAMDRTATRRAPQ